jgi:RNA polymerase sigma-70 factor (ECF subfamily)
MAGETRPRRHLRVVPDLSSLSDEDLMCRYRDGDVAAFDGLVHRYRGPLNRYLLRLTGDRTRAEELVADVFLKIHRAAPRYEPTAKFSTYLYTVAYRAGLNHRSRMSHRRDFGAGGSFELEQHQQADLQGPSIDNPERAVRVKRDLAALEAELDRLPDAHRAAFVLYYVRGMSCAEIATTLDISSDEAKGRLAYARKLLRSRLTADRRENTDR